MDLQQHADSLPSMGGQQIGPYLQAAAEAVGPDQAIVEVGCWLGAGTAQLAIGAARSGHRVSIHVYDHWTATDSEVRKAAMYTGLPLRRNQDTLPIVREHLAPFDADFHYHRGNIRRARWGGQPIGVYVDDAAKTPDAFLHVLKTFGPAWMPAQTVVFLMDIHYWKKNPNPAFRCQQRFIDQHPDHFELIHEFVTGGSVFRYSRPLEFKKLTMEAMT